ncbi:MAG: aminoacyl-tRNA hydrolase [Lachnospiraceae bacterium]|nr:aminoacyl-tRNA hydrolase [Lachnospiraceae bacterium]
MRLIAGLGNPGLKYSKTRHNAGFDTIDIIAKNHGVKIKKKEHFALTGEDVIAGEKVLLVKPMTYMNDSGEAIRALMDYYKIDSSDLIVISDDLTLDIGVLRIRAKGSAGGHNGLKSIIKCVGTNEFARLRVGVGKVPEHRTVIDHVLSRFERKDRVLVKESYQVAADAVEAMLVEGIDKAMSKYNGPISK